AAEAATRAGTLKSFGPEAERFERALAAEASSRRRAKALESLEARLAFGVDLAPVKSLTLIGIADDFMRGVKLGKAGRGLGVLLVGVGMVLLGELAERALDLGSARAPGHPQHVIGVAHARNLSPPRGNLTPTRCQCGEPTHRPQRISATIQDGIRAIARAEWTGMLAEKVLRDATALRSKCAARASFGALPTCRQGGRLRPAATIRRHCARNARGTRGRSCRRGCRRRQSA